MARKPNTFLCLAVLLVMCMAGITIVAYLSAFTISVSEEKPKSTYEHTEITTSTLPSVTVTETTTTSTLPSVTITEESFNSEQFIKDTKKLTLSDGQKERQLMFPLPPNSTVSFPEPLALCQIDIDQQRSISCLCTHKLSKNADKKPKDWIAVDNKQQKILTLRGSCLNIKKDAESNAWLVVQSRGDVEKKLNLARNWKEYENGFAHGDYLWAGLLNVYYRITRMTWMLRIELTDRDGGAENWIEYPKFIITDQKSNYQLSVEGTARGTIGNMFYCEHFYNGRINNTRFVTKDKDNLFKCASKRGGGWWYHRCYSIGLNNKWENYDYLKNCSKADKDVWPKLKASKLLIRPAS